MTDLRQSGEEQSYNIFSVESLRRRLLEDEALMVLVLNEFLDDLPRQIIALREAFQQGKDEGVARQAHKIKGGAANLGAEVLSRHMAKIERVALADGVTSTFMDEEMRVLEKEHVPALLEEIKRYLQGGG